MHYQEEIIINRPRAEVVALFDDPDNLSKWQPTLLRMEHLSGEPGTPGSQSRIVYKQGNGEMTMTETVISHNLPEEFAAKFETDGVVNINRNTFHAVGDNQTRWVTDNEFQFSSLMMKAMGFFAPFLFKGQSRKFMQNFKALAEDGTVATA